MALPLRKKKDFSTNDKIIRLYKEGKSLSEISKETTLKEDVVEGIIKRKLGQENSDAEVSDAVTESECEDFEEVSQDIVDDENGDADGLSKLEKYMLDKKKKQQEDLEDLASGKSVSLVDDYKNSHETGRKLEIPKSTSEMEGISLDSVNIENLSEPVAETNIDYMDSVDVNGEVTAASASVEIETAEQASANTTVEVSNESVADSANAAVDKMKQFAMIQINDNNSVIAKLEAELNSIEGEFALKIEKANTEFNESQNKFEAVGNKLDKASVELDNTRESHRYALEKADNEYRKRLEELEADYEKAKSDANDKLLKFEETIKSDMETLSKEKEESKRDLLDKQTVVTQLKSSSDSETEQLKIEIKKLTAENEGYQNFLV